MSGLFCLVCYACFCMKLLFVTPGASNRGGHIVLTELVRHLRAKGHHVDVLQCRAQEELPEAVSYTWRDVDPLYIVGEVRDVPEQVPVFQKFMSKLSEIDDQYDYVILDSWRTVRAAIAEGVIKDHYRQLVQSDNEFAPESPDKFWKAELFKLLPRFPLKHIHVSQVMSEVFAKRLNQAVEPSIDLGIREEFHDALHQPRETAVLKVIAVSGNFNMPSKGFSDLVSIASKLDPARFELTIVSPQKIEINLPLKTQFVSLSHPREIAELLADHDLFVGTSHNETFGFAQAEAMTVGLPTVAFDAIGNRTYMTKQNCLLATDVDDAVKKIQQLASFEERRSMAQASRESMKRWTLDRMTDQFISVLS